MDGHGYYQRKAAETCLFGCSVLTWVQQVGVLKPQSLVGQEVVPVPVERQEGHHVVAVVVADGGVGTRVTGAQRLVGPEPALIDAAIENENMSQSWKSRTGSNSSMRLFTV